jgi:hypothetical protein
MQPSDLRQEVAAVFGEIVAAKRLAGSGRTVDLEGLEKRIAMLCEAAVALRGDDGRALLPLLQDLLASLDELAESLKTASSGEREPIVP